MERIQRKRIKGWRMPKNTVYVGRPSRWGNPYPANIYGLRRSLRLYEASLEARLCAEPNFLEPLRGKDLACWCRLDQPCHADILIREINRGK